METAPLPDIFDRLLAVASDQHKLELQLVHNGRISAMRLYREQVTGQTKGNWDAARAAYEEAIARLSALYFPAAEPVGGVAELAARELFKNKKKAFDWLKGEGHKISQGKFYADCNGSEVVVYPDGRVSRASVYDYAARLSGRGGRGGECGDAVGMAVVAEQKLRDEARITRATAEKKEKENEEYLKTLDRKWLLREDALREIACLIGGLQNAFFLTVHKRASEIILTAGGKQDRFPEVCEYLEEHLVKEAFNAASTVGCDLVFQVEEEKDNYELRITNYEGVE